jgi:hypothetical protein
VKVRVFLWLFVNTKIKTNGEVVRG